MNPRPTHRQFATDTLTEIFALKRPADAILQDLFRSKKQMGSKDRAAVSDMVYGVLRNIFVLRAQGADAASELIEAFLRNEPPADSLPANIRLNLPEWLYDSLVRQHDADETARLAQALNQPGTVDLRVNTLKATREQVIAALAGTQIHAQPTPRSPVGLRLQKRGALQATPAFRDGWIEPQDVGSQLLALHVQAQPGETVVDFCAGGGGKTLALAAQLQNCGALYACDTRRASLEKLRLRAQRAGAAITDLLTLHSEHDPVLARLHGKADAVLVDAPCTGSGALRRNPERRLHTPDLAALGALQLSILEGASRLLKKDGRLVYATCSLLAEENQAVIARFLEKHPNFEAVQPPLQLLPHRDGTDGFFAHTLTMRR
ncbi:MAG: RsmB/NOP family class I SAM-dependent RNA methyltransferase [Pseudomonadota bacterium]